MVRFLCICLAGALGTGTRYLVNLWAASRFGPGFPFGTLIVNVGGCFAMGLITQIALHALNMSPTLRLALTTGFLGGLTTYSSFNQETTQLVLQASTRRVGLVNLGVTFAACFVAGLLGWAAGRRLAGE